MIKRKQFNLLTDFQKSIIKYLADKGKSADEIREDDSLKRSDGSKILKRTVQTWMKRTINKPKSGRKRILNKQQEENLVNYIQKNGKMTYGHMVSKTAFPATQRTFNNYALRNGFSNNNFINY